MLIISVQLFTKTQFELTPSNQESKLDNHNAQDKDIITKISRAYNVLWKFLFSCSEYH